MSNSVTARDLIRRSFMLIGVLGDGENPSDDMAQDALKTLNEIVDKMNADNMMTYSYRKIKVDLDGKSEYTIGLGGDINIPRPNNIPTEAYFLMPDGKVSSPMEVITGSQYNSLTLKELKGSIPSYLNFTPSFPLMSMSVYPIVNSGSVIFELKDNFKEFISLDDEIELPSVYRKFLRASLSVELSIEYSLPLNEAIVLLASDARRSIQNTNNNNNYMVMSLDGMYSGNQSGSDDLMIYRGF